MEVLGAMGEQVQLCSSESMYAEVSYGSNRTISEVHQHVASAREKMEMRKLTYPSDRRPWQPGEVHARVEANIAVPAMTCQRRSPHPRPQINLRLP